MLRQCPKCQGWGQQVIQHIIAPPDSMSQGTYEVDFMPCSLCKGKKSVTNEVAQAYIAEEERLSYWIGRGYLAVGGLIIFLIVVALVLQLGS